MLLRAGEISKIIQGELHGNPDVIVSSFSNIKGAKKGDISFLADIRYQKYLKSTKASILLVPKTGFQLKKNTTIIKVDNPAKKFADILNLFLLKTIRKIKYLQKQ